VDTGSHAELLQSSPLYARWASLQFDEGVNAADVLVAV
jgi:ATP-binding cassette subfamily B protein